MSGFSQLNPVPVANGGTGGTTSTGSGVVVLATTPTLVTPVLGAATATSINFGNQSLSNYTETGSWTPTLYGTSTPGTGQTYSSNSGTYMRIGKLIFARFLIAVTSAGTAAGNVGIAGLPIAEAGDGFYGGCQIFTYGVTGLAALNYGVFGLVDTGTTNILLRQNGSTGDSAVTIAQAGNFLLRGQATYKIA